jgi:coenzyme F420-dependent glucose-6-phosphate dehydrogenase
LTNWGYALSSEEHLPNDMVRYARMAEDAGFSFVGVSDHFHPWTDSQGQSPFVWSVLGAIAQATERVEVITGVTAPIIRIHPGIVAQAAATTAAMMPGRFSLGVGTGEALNEHIFGDRWPPADVRLEMLEEAIDVIRLLWQGGNQSHEGKHYRVENARIYTLPDPLPPIVVAAAGEKAAQLAGRAGDGLMSTAPDPDVIRTWTEAGGSGPKYAQVTVLWHEDEATAKKMAYELWPNAGASGQLSQDLPTPTHFEQAAEMVDEDSVAEKVVCGPDVGRHVAMIDKYRDAGFDHIYIHQVGPDQEGFFRFWKDELSSRL